MAKISFKVEICIDAPTATEAYAQLAYILDPNLYRSPVVYWTSSTYSVADESERNTVELIPNNDEANDE